MCRACGIGLEEGGKGEEGRVSMLISFLLLFFFGFGFRAIYLLFPLESNRRKKEE